MITRLAITTTVMIALAVAWLVPFTCILLYGTHTVREPSKVVLGLEVFFFLAVVTYGIHCILFIVRSWKKRLDGPPQKKTDNNKRRERDERAALVASDYKDNATRLFP